MTTVSLPGQDPAPPRPTRTITLRFERMMSICSAAEALPAAERAAFVLREAGDDLELRDEVFTMLGDAAAGRTTLIDQAVASAVMNAADERRNALLGQIVANYRLTDVIGHGGTGTVYLAERADSQYSAQVAIKIIESGVLGARVKSEREILARLNHPSIARMMDAGQIDDGRPYIVMEYVKGMPVDRFCDTAGRFDLRARLELFLQICSAVEYAHQNLVVHRDLKPANILVTETREPKLLDFGIAKMHESAQSDMPTYLTRVNERALTPDYASPEQINGGTITTSSDVYALGIVLYELLCGLRPYVIPPRATDLELRSLICSIDPPRPSDAVRKVIRSGESGVPEHAEMIAKAAAARMLTPDRLRQRLEGDLDAIVMRALRKEPATRYRTVEQFAEDIRRFLNREPVQARQGNWLYYSQRFARRNAVGVSAAGVFVTFLAAFGIVMSVQRQHIAEERDRATQESQRAERVSDFMLRVFTAADPFENGGRQVTANELLDRAAASINGELNEQPEVRARLLESIGRAFRRQGQPARAVEYFEQALVVRQKSGLPEDIQAAHVLTELAIAQRNSGRFKESEESFAQALKISNQHKEDSLARLRLLAELGRLELARSNVDAAQEYLAEALAISRRATDSSPMEVAGIQLEIASILSWRDDRDGAERAAREALNIYRGSTPEQHPDRVMANLRLADVLLLKGQAEEAGRLYESALNSQRILYGSSSSQVADTLDSLAQVRLAENKTREAEKLTREALATNRAARGETFFTNGYLLTSLGQILMRQGRAREAEQPVREALEIFEVTLPPDHQYVAAAEYVLGEALLETNQLPDAEAMLTASMNRWKRTEAPQWRSDRSASALGEVLHRMKKPRDAEKYLVIGYRGLVADGNADRATREKVQDRLARFYADQGQPWKMEALAAEVRKEAGTRAN